MPQYILKDSLKSNRFESLSGSLKFSDALQQAVTFASPDDEYILVEWGDLLKLSDGGTMYSISIRIARSEIAEIHEYSDTDWNVWPGVTPPVNVPLAVEVREENTGAVTRYAAWYDGTNWHYDDASGRRHTLSPMYYTVGLSVRFRRWPE